MSWVIYDVDVGALLEPLFECHLARCRGKDRVVPPDTGALAGPELVAPLTNDNIAGFNGLAAVFLYTETASGRIATIA